MPIRTNEGFTHTALVRNALADLGHALQYEFAAFFADVVVRLLTNTYGFHQVIPCSKRLLAAYVFGPVVRVRIPQVRDDFSQVARFKVGPVCHLRMLAVCLRCLYCLTHEPPETVDLVAERGGSDYCRRFVAC